jgi:hypothetical protein
MIRALPLLALVLAGCAGDRTHATVSVQGQGVDELALAQAIDLWRAGTEGHVDLTLVEGDATADLIVRVGPTKPRECAVTDIDTGVVTVNANASETCQRQWVGVLAHELGHYVANRTDHSKNYRALMWPVTHDATEITTADRDYLEGK